MPALKRLSLWLSKSKSTICYQLQFRYLEIVKTAQRQYRGTTSTRSLSLLFLL